jgi:transposase InsO family protein
LLDIAQAYYSAHSLDKLPNRATIYRWLAKWKANNPQLYAGKKDPDQGKKKKPATVRPLSDYASYAGQMWQLASTPADIRTMEADGSRRRCAIVAAIDVYSRRVVCIADERSKAAVVAMTIKKAIKTWGIPEKIFMDNISDYQSGWLLGLTKAFKIDTPLWPSFKSETKGNIERFFETMALSLAQRLPSYVVHSVKERAAIEERQHWVKEIFLEDNASTYGDNAIDIPLSQERFTKALEMWLKVYESTHCGFEADGDKSKEGLNPLQAFEQSKTKAPMLKNFRVLDTLPF